MTSVDARTLAREFFHKVAGKSEAIDSPAPPEVDYLAALEKV